MCWYHNDKNKSKADRVWTKHRRKAPRVPDITCPWIDDVLKRLEDIKDNGKPITAKQLKVLNGKMERLRSANEKLRESGQYWHDAARDIIDDFYKYKNYKRPTYGD